VSEWLPILWRDTLVARHLRLMYTYAEWESMGIKITCGEGRAGYCTVTGPASSTLFPNVQIESRFSGPASCLVFDIWHCSREWGHSCVVHLNVVICYVTVTSAVFLCQAQCKSYGINIEVFMNVLGDAIETGYGPVCRGLGVRVSARARFFSFPRSPDWLWGLSNLLSNGYRALFPRG
jgi:hypothetical protein